MWTINSSNMNALFGLVLCIFHQMDHKMRWYDSIYFLSINFGLYVHTWTIIKRYWFWHVKIRIISRFAATYFTVFCVITLFVTRVSSSCHLNLHCPAVATSMMGFYIYPEKILAMFPILHLLDQLEPFIWGAGKYPPLNGWYMHLHWRIPSGPPPIQ